MRTAGGIAPKPWAVLPCHDRMPVEESKGRASHAGCGVVVPHATIRAQGMRIAGAVMKCPRPAGISDEKWLRGAGPMDAHAAQLRHQMDETRAAMDAKLT